MITLNTIKKEVVDFMGSEELLVKNNILLHTQKAENIITNNPKKVAMSLLNQKSCELFEDIAGCLTHRFDLVVNVDFNRATNEDWVYLLDRLKNTLEE